MGNKLLVRAYNVGVGDCIYVRIPNGEEDFHILIDCGTKGSTELLNDAINHMRAEMLPDGDEAGKKRLDLVVVTHRHQDHIKGFDPALFANIEIKNIWLSAGMDENHPQAEKTQNLHRFAARAMQEVEAQGLALSPEMEMLVSLYSVSNDVALEALMSGLPAQNGIEPVYVHAGMSSNQLNLGLEEARITVLGPEADIDGFYLGKETDASLSGLQSFGTLLADHAAGEADAPQNISPLDFRRLQSRMLSNALAFAASDSSIQNNVSVVLLIEWRQRRLLFVGDAEWHGEFREGKHNGSWNVMWHQRREQLQKPIDFLKIGHHGSVNSTPRRKDKDADYEVNQILDALLPLPGEGESPTAQAIVSTERSTYKTIPEADLLVELGKRVRNVRLYKDALGEKANLDLEKDINAYYAEYEALWLDKPQPWRTDLEHLLTGAMFVDIEIEPAVA